MSTAESSCTKRSSAIGCSKSRKVVFTASVFYWERIERAPQVPGGDRAPGLPGGTQPHHCLQRDFSVLEIGEANRFLQAQVVERKHVGAQQVEDQEHLGRPATDAAHLDKVRDDLLVAHLG